jgi:hypothetical protein
MGQAKATVTCQACGKVHELVDSEELSMTPKGRYMRALDYSQSEGIDLASAYSVLLGLMSPDLAQQIARNGTHDSPPIDGAGEPNADYDRGFRKAVAGGHLTVKLAAMRGDRVKFASDLAREHGLPMHVAFELADNRISLREALEHSQKASQVGGAAPSGAFASPYFPRVMTALLLGLAVLVVALLLR